MASPAGAPIKAAPAGYVITRALLPVQDLGLVSVIRMDNPASEATHIYSGGRRYLTTRPSQRAIRLAELTGADLVFYDYPGRNGTTIHGNVDTLIAFGPAFVEALRGRGWIGNGPLYAHGYSFGGAMAAGIARSSGFDGLILENTSSDIIAVTRASIPFFLRPFVALRLDQPLTRFPYVDYIVESNIPVLLFSGARDTIVPERLVEAFRDELVAAGVTVSYVSTPEVHGNAIYTDVGLEAFREFYQRQ